MVDSLSNDVERALGPGMKNLVEGRRCNPAVAELETCIINQLEATSYRGDHQSSDILLNHSKQSLCTNSGRGTEGTSSSSSSNHSSTVDSESFHTVFNDSSNGSIIVEGAADKILTQPGSITEPCESLEAAAVNQAQADDSKYIEADDIKVQADDINGVESSATLKTCALNTCGVILTIQSADLEVVKLPLLFPLELYEFFTPGYSKVYKAKEALGQFMVIGNKLRPSKVACLTLIPFNLGSVCVTLLPTF